MHENIIMKSSNLEIYVLYGMMKKLKMMKYLENYCWVTVIGLQLQDVMLFNFAVLIMIKKKKRHLIWQSHNFTHKKFVKIHKRKLHFLDCTQSIILCFYGWQGEFWTKWVSLCVVIHFFSNTTMCTVTRSSSTVSQKIVTSVNAEGIVRIFH